MRVYRGYSRPVGVSTVLTIGNFDGLHLGHRALLARVQALAAAAGQAPAVLTFEPHPREYFSRLGVADDGAPARLSILREKLESLGEAGITLACVCPFNAGFAALSAEEFVGRVLVDCLGVKTLVIGDDFRFGARRSGDFALLQQLGAQHGFSVEAVSSVRVDGERVSSSGVRDALSLGDMERAARLLGRPYTMDGRVVHGRKLGRTLGFPTANIYIRHDPLPMRGVFAVEVDGLGQRYQGVANLGLRPTVAGGARPVLEVHLFDFFGNLYGAHLTVRFVHKLRDEQRFPDIEALRRQIEQDAAGARTYFQAGMTHHG